MSRFSFSSSLSLFQSVTLTDSDATSSSTSSNSAINNSSGSLSLSPQSSSSGANPTAATACPASNTLTTTSNNNCSIAALLFERQAREPPKFANIKQLNNISDHLLELQREIKEEEEEIFADINSLINNRSNLYSSFDDDTDDHDDTLGGVTNTTASTTICTHPYRASNSNNISGGSSNSTKNKLHQGSDYFQEDEDQGLDQETDLLGDENLTQRHQYPDGTKNSGNNNIISSNLNNNIHHDHFNGEDYVLCNRVSGQQRQQHQHIEEQSEQEQHRYLEHVHGDEDKHHLHEQQQQQHRHEDDDDDHDQQQLDDYQAIQREDILQLTNNLPKPCVFFLEGNCRRSDCKYSHDLSSITCKYWIEGFCFKGEMCPFLHSFNQKGLVSNSLDDDLVLTKERLNPTFAIESEADFPSLPLDAPNVTLSASSTKETEVDGLNIKNQILSSNPAVVFKTTKKKRKKG